MAVPSSFIMVICQSEKPYVSIPSARSFLAISLALLRAASTFGKASSRSVTTVVLFENSTLNLGMLKETTRLRPLSCVNSCLNSARYPLPKMAVAKVNMAISPRLIKIAQIRFN